MPKLFGRFGISAGWRYKKWFNLARTTHLPSKVSHPEEFLAQLVWMR
ncbi:Hypothetical protein DIP0224 [Corynebacterium diphtheriae]|uniref:Transposase n=1 Tax=Corynebacterium diphtheriae (strain ATCC 700971 / NCTC 13129 / Biotype gravis) TaxID=257309 RepID=Q6NK13_CORDI|nr:Hypothetical protein DIP0224 [Corynebacterium diphtheriae]